MKTLRLLLLASLVAGSAPAQFYAPETEYHDIAQRTFPVEAARVLAWQRGADAASIAEITYQIETTPERETRWSIQWRDAAGHALRERAVRYPETLLTRGPEFFREVFRQLCGEDWKIAGDSGGRLALAFWDGARRAGISRPEAITAARQYLADNPRVPEAADAARLAGILSHGALPIFASQLTIDSVLLSRAAAWLCLAEARRGQPCAPAWPPLLFLAGREQLAGTLWRTLPAVDPGNSSTAERFWEAMLRAPSVAASFDFTTKPENRQHAVAAMAYQARCDPAWQSILGAHAYDVAPALDRQRCLREYEYTPVLDPGDSSREDIFKHWAGAWLRLLDGFAEGEVDVTRVSAALSIRPVDDYPELTALVAACAPLLDLALPRSSGPLRPVAIVSTADVLGYGWECAGVQLGDLAHALQWRTPSQAPDFREDLLARVKSFAPFLPAAAAVAVQVPDGLDRLQFIVAPHFSGSREYRRAGVPERSAQRCWLWKDGGTVALEAMLTDHAPDAAIRQTLERMLEKGGQLAVANLLKTGGRKIDAVSLRPRLFAALPSAYSARCAEVENRFQKDGDAFHKAQNLERLAWQYGALSDSWAIFLGYLAANAPTSAMRFGARIAEFDPLNRLGAPRFTLAWLENDDAGMRAALADEIRSDDLNNPLLAALDALIRGDSTAAAAILVPATATGQWWTQPVATLRAFLPLLPALRDPAHADHARALDGFRAVPYGAFAQWILLRTAGLSDNDSVRFLGGEKSPPVQQMLIAAVRGEGVRFEELYQRHAGPHADVLDPEVRPLILHLRCQLLHVVPPAEEPDLMPAGALPLEARIRARFDTSTTEGKIARSHALAEIFGLPNAEPEAKIEAAEQIGQYALAMPTDFAMEMLRPIPDVMLRWLEDYPANRHARRAAEICVGVDERLSPPGTLGILEKLAAHPNSDVSSLGIEGLRRRGLLGVTLSKPVEFAFTALDGREVDLTKLRGKVVLLDFWASWCGPCIAEIPDVVAAFEKYHARGFEIVGISLDGTKANLEAAVRKHRLTWPQFFSGEREDVDGFSDPLAVSLGLVGIPYECLLDKRGMLRFTALRGQRLAEAIEQLLAE